MTALLAAALAAATLTATAPHAAAAATGKAAAPAAAPAGLLSAQQATARAKSTGKPVEVTSLTSGTSLTEANPDGTLTLTESAVPTRVRQHGQWTNLDATLKANPDGTLSPTASLNQVVLSGGGSAPFASLYTGGQGLSLTLPITLPRPTVSGSSAVYADVLPGVDLTVTVQTDGAVSDVFTLRTPAAARNPQLATLLTSRTTTTRGLKVQSDTAGNLAVTDAAGHPLYTAPTPLAWDSATAPSTTAFTTRSTGTTGVTPTTQSSVIPRTAAAQSAPTSTFGAPGRNAHVAGLKADAHPGSITLAAPTTLLTGPGTVWPVYLDPTLSPEYGNTGWSSPGSGVGGDSYWKKSVSYSGDAEVGNSGDVQGEAMSIFDFPIDLKTLRGANIYDAEFGIKEDYSWACPTSGHNQTVDLYAPSQVLTSSNATWNAWVGNLGSSVASHPFALGYNSSCPANYTPPFNVKTQINNDINGTTPKPTQTLVMRADDHSDNYAFKQFDPKTAQLTVTYDQYPNTPTGLKTSPATNCTSTVLGDTSVTLYAVQSTVMKSSLTTTFSLYKTSDSTKTNLLTPANGIASNTWTGGSGQSAVLTVPESFYKARAGGAATTFAFIARSSDGTLASKSWSTACTFTWDPTKPGAPSVSPDPAPTGGAQTCATRDSTIGTTQPIGTVCSFVLDPPTTGGTTDAIAAYVYQVNQSSPVQVTATGSTTVSVPLSHLVNTLTVSALSAGGNIGASDTVWFDGSALSPPAKDGDLTLDGTADLLVPGSSGGTAFPPGLWLAPGDSDGTVSGNAVDIGISGLGFNTSATPTDWNGAQTVTGDFCGNGAQDVLAYFPTGANAGGGTIACNDGTTGPLNLGGLEGGSAPFQISAGSLVDDNSDNATRVAAAGNTSGQGTGLPDLLATINNQLFLFYSTTPNGYSDPSDFGLCAGGCNVLTGLNTPDGTQDWNSWTLATTQLPTGTALYLWNRTTGDLDLWTGLALDPTGTTLTTTGQYTVASGWNTGKTRILQAADLAGTGIPDLWATDPATGTSTAYLPANLANNPTLTTTTTTTTTANHAWDFQDIGTNTAGSALTSTIDSIGTQNLTVNPDHFRGHWK
ncbi:hypothetical protein [Streptacidiphilus sp. PAMC 29251]